MKPTSPNTTSGAPAQNPPDETGSHMPSSEAAMRHYALIGSQPYFKGLSTRHLKTLASAAVQWDVAAGDPIFQEGDQANRFFIILDGEVLLESDTKDHGRIPVQTIGPGDDLGWSWLFPPYHTQFSARAVTPVKMLLFFAPQLRQQCEADHDLGYELLKRVASVMLTRLQALRHRLSEESKKDRFPAF